MKIEEVVAVRIENGIKQIEFAELIGIPIGTWSNVEKGRQPFYSYRQAQALRVLHELDLASDDMCAEDQNERRIREAKQQAEYNKQQDELEKEAREVGITFKEDVESWKGIDPTMIFTGKVDMVNNPPHYNASSMETIDIIAIMTENLKGIEAVCVGNMVKYSHRFKYKNGVEDLKKARWYLDKLIMELEKE